jgi:hypothetical protein
MNGYHMLQIDNRDPEQMYLYLEARIDVLTRRISELETENQLLRIRKSHESHGSVSEDLAVALGKVRPFIPATEVIAHDTCVAPRTTSRSYAK